MLHRNFTDQKFQPPIFVISLPPLFCILTHIHTHIHTCIQTWVCAKRAAEERCPTTTSAQRKTKRARRLPKRSVWKNAKQQQPRKQLSVARLQTSLTFDIAAAGGQCFGWLKKPPARRAMRFVPLHVCVCMSVCIRLYAAIHLCLWTNTGFDCLAAARAVGLSPTLQFFLRIFSLIGDCFDFYCCFVWLLCLWLCLCVSFNFYLLLDCGLHFDCAY